MDDYQEARIVVSSIVGAIASVLLVIHLLTGKDDPLKGSPEEHDNYIIQRAENACSMKKQIDSAHTLYAQCMIGVKADSEKCIAIAYNASNVPMSGSTISYSFNDDFVEYRRDSFIPLSNKSIYKASCDLANQPMIATIESATIKAAGASGATAK